MRLFNRKGSLVGVQSVDDSNGSGSSSASPTVPVRAVKAPLSPRSPVGRRSFSLSSPPVSPDKGRKIFLAAEPPLLTSCIKSQQRKGGENNENNNTVVLPKKIVRFDESQNNASKGAANARFSRNCWYVTKDLVHFKATAVLQAKHLSVDSAHNEMRYKTILTRVYAACCHNRSHKDTCLNHKIEGYLSLNEQAELAYCMNMDDAFRLGLERIIVKEIRDDSAMRRTQILQEIQEVQELEAGGCGIPETVKAEHIRNSVELYSLPSRLFAQAKGRALAPQPSAAHQQKQIENP